MAVTTPIENPIFGIVLIVKKMSDAQTVIEVCYGVTPAAISLPEALATDFWITPATGSSSSGAIGYTIHRETGGSNSEATAFTTQQATGGTNSEATVFTIPPAIRQVRKIEDKKRKLKWKRQITTLLSHF